MHACLLGSLESNSFKPNYWPPQWPLLITVQCPKETDINSSEKKVPLASTSRPGIASLTTPSDELDLIPEFGIIEFTTETEAPNSTEVSIQQPSTISTMSKTISITAIKNQEIETTENIVTTNTPVETPEKTVPLASTLRPDLASLTTPFDKIDLIPEFGIIEFTTETETPNFTEILFQQSSTISTSPKTISITTNLNQGQLKKFNSGGRFEATS